MITTEKTNRDSANLKAQGVRKKASFISALVWNPFDKRFNDLILRFEDHRKLFELEMNVSSSAEALRFYKAYEENMRNGENSRQKIRPDEQQQEQEDMGKVPCLPKNATLKIQSSNARPSFERVDKSTPMARAVRPCTSPTNPINWFMALSRTNLQIMVIKCDEAIDVHFPENYAYQRYSVLFPNS